MSDPVNATPDASTPTDHAARTDHVLSSDHVRKPDHVTGIDRTLASDVELASGSPLEAWRPALVVAAAVVATSVIWATAGIWWLFRDWGSGYTTGEEIGLVVTMVVAALLPFGLARLLVGRVWHRGLVIGFGLGNATMLVWALILIGIF